MRLAKMKNTRSVMSNGLPVARLNYSLYFVRLSKWFVLVLVLNF